MRGMNNGREPTADYIARLFRLHAEDKLRAVEEEREACAEIADAEAHRAGGVGAAVDIAAAIRARRGTTACRCEDGVPFGICAARHIAAWHGSPRTLDLSIPCPDGHADAGAYCRAWTDEETAQAAAAHGAPHEP